jgi:hypothetical protein
MKTLRFLYIALAAVLGMTIGATRASANNLTFTCDPSIDATQAGTCAYLNSTVSSLYTSAFSNVNANIYIQQGITGLGSSTPGFYNVVPYRTYLADLTATASNDTVDVAALAALNSLDTPLYGIGNVVITTALGELSASPTPTWLARLRALPHAPSGLPVATTASSRSQPRRTSLPKLAARNCCTGTKPEAHSRETLTISIVWYSTRPTKS